MGTEILRPVVSINSVKTSLFGDIKSTMVAEILRTVVRKNSAKFLSNENLIFVEHVPSQCTSAQPLPVVAYTWLVKHLSRERDTVVDVESDTGYPVVAALKQGSSAVWINTASHYKKS